MTLAGKVIIKIKCTSVYYSQKLVHFATKEKKYSSISGFMYVFYGPAAWLVHVFESRVPS